MGRIIPPALLALYLGWPAMATTHLILSDGNGEGATIRDRQCRRD